ncbi:MAG: HipA domain-containing protein [Verrucomicrobia bacterium]|nr:HipA domain-containing protein [Verrucomicrobiota bacterium]
MNRCPITYEHTENHYSEKGLKLLKLTQLKDFPYGRSQQLELAVSYSDKLSFSGVQPKLNAKIDPKLSTFEPVRSGGIFILKLPHAMYEDLPQNEDLTMRMASLAKIEVPLHGMVYAVDRSLVYFVKRFDRNGRKKLPVEDFGQLAGLPKEAKYDSSMEKLIPIIDRFCTFKHTEKTKLFRLTLFNFLVGNEDMHLKNFSLMTTEAGVVQLTPAYDLINSTIVMKAKEEIGLPLNGKKSNFKRADFIEYFGTQRLNLPESLIAQILSDLASCLIPWKELIEHSFLKPEKKEDYAKLLEERAFRLF